MIFRVLVLFAALASAFELPTSLSRRSFARAAAVAPLGFAAAAFADADNKFLGVAKVPSEKLSFETTSDARGSLGNGLSAIGRQAAVDDSGSAVPLAKNPPGMPSVASYTAAEASALVNGVEKSLPSYSAGMARLMAN